METDYDRIKAYFHRNPHVEYTQSMDAGGIVIEILTPGFPTAVLCFGNDGMFTTIFAVE